MFKNGKPGDGFPSVYDEHIAITIPYYESFHREIINFVRSSRSTPRWWLDTGCGTGTLVCAAAQAFPDTSFILADPSEEMLAQAKKKLQWVDSSFLNILDSCSTADIVLGYSVNPEIITAVLCHHYLDMPGRQKAVNRCYRLLAPGGLFITFENIRPSTEAGTRGGLQYWKLFQLDHGKSEQETESHLSRFGKEYFPITINQHISLLTAAGFRTVEMLWYSYMQAGFYAVK